MVYNIRNYKDNLNSKEFESLRNEFFELSPNKKYNYETIRKIYESFWYDSEFLDRVYIDIVTNVHEIWIFEFMLRQYDILSKRKKIDIKKYIQHPNHNIIGVNELVLNELFIEIKKDDILRSVNQILDNSSSALGLGFSIIENMFSYSKVILDFFSKYMVDKILWEMDLEKYLHQHYECFTDFCSMNNLTSFIIKRIGEKDICLSHYVIKNSEILDDWIYVFDYIKKNWDYYDNKTEDDNDDVYLVLFEQIFDYIKTRSNDDVNTITELWNNAFYASYNCGILEQFFRFSYGFDEEYLQEIKEICEQHNEMNSEKTIHYLYFSNIINNALNSKNDIACKKKVKQNN